ASGIGAATVREFAREGAIAIIFDINVQAGEEVAASLQQEGLRASFLRLDVADADACREAVQAVFAQHGRLDYLVNSAASFLGKGLDATTADWEQSLGVNVRGGANMAQACHGPMKQTGGGAIVNISSISGHIAQPNRWTYNACKGGILAMTRCQALDMAPDNIRVNVVSPGWTWTPEVAKAANGDREKWEPVWGRFSMLRRLGEAREIARAILFLCSDDASFITGAELPVDGGYLGLGSEGLGDRSTFAGTA
ncbi:MAG TPA: SDR family oxidoreductase, partial [Chthonomonadaceae bacterium]|nr:SDR family oxidoreductase [Chthonomonadaceae bacterium]